MRHRVVDCGRALGQSCGEINYEVLTCVGGDHARRKREGSWYSLISQTSALIVNRAVDGALSHSFSKWIFRVM